MVLLLILSLLLTFPLLPLVLPSFAPNSPLLLPLLLIIALLLSVSCAYLQSAVFALAALWGSNETLAVMSGQGGIAVLVSGAQVILAIVSALHSGTPVESGSAAQSTLAGVGLWAIGSLGAVGCMIAHRHLLRHPDYSLVLAPVRARRQALEQGSESIKTKEMSMTRHVFRKNIALEAAVAWVFVVTLSVFPPITTAILSIHAPPPRLLQPAVFIPIHFVVFNSELSSIVDLEISLNSTMSSWRLRWPNLSAIDIISFHHVTYSSPTSLFDPYPLHSPFPTLQYHLSLDLFQSLHQLRSCISSYTRLLWHVERVSKISLYH